MNISQQSGRQCSAVLANGRRCRQKALNGLDKPLCSRHTPGRKPHAHGYVRHGFYDKGQDPRLEYLRRVRPEDYIQAGGLALTKGTPISIRERELDLHPPQPEQMDVNVAIAALVHKMEILDALIFRAREHGLDIANLLSLYLVSTARLGTLIRERHAMSSNENDDLMALLQRANEQLDQDSGA